jgi:hypothetical protein
MWSVLWPAPDLISHPPLALVFAKDVSEPVLWRRIAAVRDASREHWAAPWTSYEGRGRRTAGVSTAMSSRSL